MKILRPVAFMVMPFRKQMAPSPPEGAPAIIDCDALWDKAFRPARTLLNKALSWTAKMIAIPRVKKLL